MTPRQAFRLTRRCTRQEFRLMRKSLGLTQHDLARLFGMVEQSVARMEKGQARINYAAEMLLRAMVIQHADIPLNLMSWLKRFARRPGD